ncbi:DJ-1/PfpI family protein [Mycoplasma buteonis]|uniref:DJ-1/PfpI family protein n=1 Tax=Mycoplasma buteonis TaxID=171280 RepID=UPI000566DD21|nr:DJ-1/PfpI family protein [Mycoplasma buteonis]
MKLLVIIEPKFNDVELTTVLSCLRKASPDLQIDYFHPEQREVSGQYDIVKVDNLVNEINLEEYHAVFVPGGQGAQTLRQNKVSLEIIQKANMLHKYIFAICDAPNVLREANILDDKTPFSAYPSDWAKDLQGKYYLSNYVIHSTKNIYTARCADASMKLGLKMVSVLLGKDAFKNAYCGMTGHCSK